MTRAEARQVIREFNDAREKIEALVRLGKSALARIELAKIDPRQLDEARSVGYDRSPFNADVELTVRTGLVPRRTTSG